MASTKTYIDVAYADKDIAKSAGARWDGEAKRWYVPLNVPCSKLVQFLRPENLNDAVNARIDYLADKTAWLSILAPSLAGLDYVGHGLQLGTKARHRMRFDVCRDMLLTKQGRSEVEEMVQDLMYYEALCVEEGKRFLKQIEAIACDISALQ